MRFIIGTLLAAAVTGAAFVHPAEARCFWNGFETVCVHHHGFGFERPFAYRDYGPPRPFWWGGY
jgi:hypothetical protein